MAKKRHTPKEGSTAPMRGDERVEQAFAQQLIKMLEGAKQDWTKPWFSDRNTGAPRNFDGRRYAGMNQLYLALVQNEMGYQLPVWITFQKAKELGVNVVKGEKSVPVWLGSRIILDGDGKKISKKEFDNLSTAEQQMCTFRPFAKMFSVFNIQQTNYAEVHPQEYSELKEKMRVRTVHDAEGMAKSPELDHMLQSGTWVCSIESKQSDDAFYSVTKDNIVVPLKKQFKSGESFYSTLLHEMAHSTGAESRLDRFKQDGLTASESYAREELVAEMTAAIVSNSLGMNSGIKEDSVPYLQHWLDELHQQPKFMHTLMRDINKACAFIEDRILSLDVKQAAQEGIERLEQQVTEIEPDMQTRVDKNIDDVQDIVPEEVNEANGVDKVNVEADEVRLGMDTAANNNNNNKVEASRVDEGIYRPEGYGKDALQTKLHMAFLGGGISCWEDGDNDYTAHISTDRQVTFHKDFAEHNADRIRTLAESGNVICGGDRGTLALNPVRLADRVLYNKSMDQAYPVSVERVGDKHVYCTGMQVLPDSVEDRLAVLNYPREYVFSITGLDTVRDKFYMLAKNGMDFSDMDDMLQLLDDVIRTDAITKDERNFKTLYFLVNDNKVVKSHRDVNELGADLPLYWFSSMNVLSVNHPGGKKALSPAQQLVGSELIVKLQGADTFGKVIDDLEKRGISFQPSQTRELYAALHSTELDGEQRAAATMYLFIKDGLVVDSEARINEAGYDLPMFVADGKTVTAYDPRSIKTDNTINNHLKSNVMATKNNEAAEGKKELKDGIHLFALKSGDAYGIREIKDGIPTATVRIPKDAPELSAFFEAVKGKDKTLRDVEIKKLADKFLTPENLAKAAEKKAEKATEQQTEQNAESRYIRLAALKPEQAARITNVHAFKMQDGKTMAVSCDIDGVHMTAKPMGEKLQNTFFSKAKGTSGDAKKELDMQVAAMVFRKELAEPVQEQQQSSGMKR